MQGPWRCLLLFLSVQMVVARSTWTSRDGRIQLPTGESFPRQTDKKEEVSGTKWALLIAGSSGYGNYRHQADVCHAYQLLHNNGLKDENIVVMMYDDIAYNPENPRPGVIINHPDGQDLYHNVPKDYTGRNVNVKNFLAVLLGNKTAVQGIGSGKVIDSGPNDHVFVYYTDHGGPGVLGMPNLPFLFGTDIIRTLKTKHAAKGYKELVFYLEACESGSIFEGLLPGDMGIYATTAANSMESSWGCYCPGMDPGPPAEYETCLGDLYSIAWMEDSDIHNLAQETLYDQFKIVRDRTSNHGTFERGSHVMQYGQVKINKEECADYLGTDPANDDAPLPDIPPLSNGVSSKSIPIGLQMFYEGKKAETVSQRDAELLHLWHKYKNAVDGTDRKSSALQELQQVTSERSYIDRSVKLITQLLVGPENDASSLRRARVPAGLPLVDDWDCLKRMVRVYETHCGLLSQYGMKHMRVFANICNRGIPEAKVALAAGEACSSAVSSWTNEWSLHRNGDFSA